MMCHIPNIPPTLTIFVVVKFVHLILRSIVVFSDILRILWNFQKLFCCLAFRIEWTIEFGNV